MKSTGVKKEELSSERDKQGRVHVVTQKDSGVHVCVCVCVCVCLRSENLEFGFKSVLK